MPTSRKSASQLLDELEKKRRTVKPSDDHLIFREIFGWLGTSGPILADEEGLHELRDDLNALGEHVHFDFVKSNAKTALVAERNDKAYIAMTTGFSWLLMRLFGTLLSDPKFSPKIGDPEKIPAEFFEWQLKLFRDDPFIKAIALPSCKKRSDVILGLISCAHTFLFFHEYSHFLLRHLEYLESNGALSVIDESDPTDGRQALSEILQIMELEADRTAILTSLRYWRSIPESEHFDESFGISGDEVWLLAVETVMVLFEHLSKENKLVEGLTHPPALDRWAQLKWIAHFAAEESDVSNIPMNKRNLNFAQTVNDFLKRNEVSEHSADYSADVVTKLVTESLPRAPEVMNQYISEISKIQTRFWDKNGVSPPTHWERAYFERE